MAEASGLRLDAEVWALSPLGVVGPLGLLGDVAHGGESVYRPLLVHHLDHAKLVDDLDRSVGVLRTFDEVADLLKGSGITRLSYCPPELARSDAAELWERDHKVGVVVRNRAGDMVHAVFVASPRGFGERVAHVTTCWVPNLAVLRAYEVDQLLAAGWARMFHELARSGMVGVTASESFEGRAIVSVLRDIAGFRPAADYFSALGLAPADAMIRLTEWRVTVEAGSVTRFASAPELAGAARADLLHRLLAYFAVAGRRRTDEREQDPAEERVTIGGEVAIDGIRGWGNVQPGDWYRPEPDNMPDGWQPAQDTAMSAFLAWLRTALDSAPDT
jgi:hypothetical protein